MTELDIALSLGCATLIGLALGLDRELRGNARNLASAANIWLAAALGIAAGAGRSALVLLGAGYGLAILTLVRLAESRLPGSVEGEQRRAWAQRAREGAVLRRDRAGSKPPADDDPID